MFESHFVSLSFLWPDVSFANILYAWDLRPMVPRVRVWKPTNGLNNNVKEKEDVQNRFSGMKMSRLFGYMVKKAFSVECSHCLHSFTFLLIKNWTRVISHVRQIWKAAKRVRKQPGTRAEALKKRNFNRYLLCCGFFLTCSDRKQVMFSESRPPTYVGYKWHYVYMG